MLVPVYLMGGLLLLVLGGEGLVRGASRLASAFRIAPLVIGLTVVAFGTSAPEASVSVQSALAGQADIAFGNVVGSNIFNVLFILGLSALIAPLVVAQQLIRLDVPLLIAVSCLLYLLASDGVISRMDGMLLFAGILAYTVFLLFKSRQESTAIQAEYTQALAAKENPSARITSHLLWIMGGLALLVLGARLFVTGAVDLARWLGVSELVIGLTVVAAGTSLPEVAASVIASLRGERDIAVGNVIGSNLFNILGVLGLTSLIAPAGVAVAPAALAFDLPVMIAVALACLPIFFTGHRISRWEGGLFMLYYAIYTGFLILKAGQHAALAPLSMVMLGFVLPLTAMTLLVSVWRTRRAVVQ